MFQIDVASASPTLPAPAAAGTPGFFTEGDPLAGTPATLVDEAFMNMIMMELINVVLAGGLAPSKTDYSQVKKAILAMILGPSPVIGPAGSIALAGGILIVKWGTLTVPATASPTVTVPVNFADAYAGATAFPNACFGLLGNPKGTPQPINWGPLTVQFPDGNRTKAAFSCAVDTTDPSHNITQSVPIFWVAFGN